jgi:group I intron endonuclease
MTICIYGIFNTVTGQVYVGKTKDHKARWWQHRNELSSETRNRNTNRHLWNSARKYGLAAFDFRILEEFPDVDEALIAARELFWMDHHRSCDRNFGFNLRRDSSTGMIQHAETKIIKSLTSLGERNPNFGNKWTDEQKRAMSLHARFRHTLGIYDAEWRKKIGASASAMWKDEGKTRAMAEKVRAKKLRYRIRQLDRAGNLIRTYDSVHHALLENPGYKWQNIYSVCNGYKKTYMNCIWQKEPIHG